MARFTKSERAKIPAAKFAGPHRSFPIPDVAHAKAALMDVSGAHISPHEKAVVREAAHRELARAKK